MMSPRREQPEQFAGAFSHDEALPRQLTHDQIYQIRRVIVRRWARAVVGYVVTVTAMAGLIWFGWLISGSQRLPLSEVLILALLYVFVVAVYLATVSRRLRNLRSLARTPVQTVDGPILVSEHGAWFRDGKIFTWVNPYDHWMHLLPSLHSTLDPAYRYRLSYVKLLRSPCQYFVVGADMLGVVSQAEISTLNEFPTTITPVSDVSGD